MAAVAATIPEWETARKIRCFQQFIKLQCVKSGHEELLNADAEDFDITLLDERKMKTLILDCAAALGFVQQERVRQGKPLILQEGEQPLTKETQAASNRIFATVAKSILDQELTYEDALVPSPNEGMKQLFRAFPDDSKLTDGRGWLPLHWAAVVDNVTEADVKLVCTSDPMALQRHHLQGTGLGNMGFTPAHLLCIQAITNRNMSLIRNFSKINQQAFAMSSNYPNRGDPYSFSALHAACRKGQPTEELIKHLLQLDSSQTRKKCSKNGFTPVGYLCANSSCSDRLVNCLLEVDSSVEVVVKGIAGCLESTDYSRILDRVDMLLKANPEAAKYRDSNGANLLHLAVRQKTLSFQLCIDIMQRIHTIHKDAIREVSSSVWLPVHAAVRYGTVEVMEYLLGLYPESASVIISVGLLNLLHLAVNDNKSTTSVVEAKVRFLCSRYPAMMLQRDRKGGTPLHVAIFLKNISAVQILCEIGGQELIRAPVTDPANDSYWLNGWLPLHFLANWNAESLRDSLLSKTADCFRMLLRLHPEAAGIEGGVVFKETPYQLAVERNLPPYYLRLLLRAAPDLNPAELHRLNYAERRMAMFLAFKAVSSQPEPLLLVNLRFEKMDLVKHVISFL